jgi:hypothetical protein
MKNSMNSENKIDRASNFKAWKTRIDLILAKNKVLDIVKGKIVKPEFEEGEEKEPQNVAAMEKFKDVDINAMSIIVNSIKYHLIPYISHLDSSKMYDALTNLFSVRNIGQVMSLKNELCDMKMNDDDNITSYFMLGTHNVPLFPYFFPPLHSFSLTFKLILSLYPIFPKVYNVSSLYYTFNLFFI